MSSVIDTLFGGTDKSQLKSQKRANELSQQFIRDMQAQSRSDVMGLAPGAQQNLNMGMQAGLDVYGQTIPQMFDVFQQGNVGAQNALLAGMPQFQNAILGLPVDYNAFQPQALNYNTDFAQQQLPDFIPVADALGGVNNGAQAAPLGGAGALGGARPVKTRPSKRRP